VSRECPRDEVSWSSKRLIEPIGPVSCAAPSTISPIRMDRKTLRERPDVRACGCTAFMNERVKSRKKALKKRDNAP
jgi:hypothetical protein